MKQKWIYLSVLVLMHFALTGYRSSRGGFSEMKYSLSNAAGQVDAGYSSGMFVSNHNPATLIYNTSPKLLLKADSSQNDFDPFTYGTSLLYSYPHLFTIGASFQKSTLSGSPSLIDTGFGWKLGQFFALGAAFSYQSTSQTWDGRAGFLFFPSPRLRFGLSAYSLVGGVNAFGAGVSLDPAPSVTLSADITSNEKLKEKTLTAGLRFTHQGFSLSGGYALGIDSTVSIAQSVPRNKPYAAIGYWFANRVDVNLYYQHQNAKYYGEVGFRF